MEQPCHHGYTHAPNLLPNSSLFGCAVCFMEARIGEVKVAQAALTGRGGIFASLNGGPDWCKADSNGKNWMTHRDWTKQWRSTSLNCWKLVATLKKLRDEKYDMVEEWGIDEALHLWELSKDECSQVPGYRHAGDSTSTVEKEVSQSHNMQAVSESALTENASSEDDWETAKRRWKKRLQPLNSILKDKSEQADADEAILKERKEITNRLEDLSITSENRFEALAKDSRRATTGVGETTKKPRCIPNGDATLVKSGSLQKTILAKPRSALKSTSASPPKTRKTVSIDAQATILPFDTAPATKTPHHEHTLAEKSHKPLSYHRNSRFYTASSCWASPEGYVKANTSHSKDTWATVDELQKEFAVPGQNAEENVEALTEKADKAVAEKRGERRQG